MCPTPFIIFRNKSVTFSLYARFLAASDPLSEQGSPVSCCIKAFSCLQTGAFLAGAVYFPHIAQGRIFLESSNKVALLFPVASIQHQHEVENESHRAVKALFSWVTTYSSATGKSFLAVVPWDCGWTQIPQNLTEKCFHSSHNIQYILYFTMHHQH